MPNIFIVGAPRAGTTTLYALLRRSDEIYASDLKEPWTLALLDGEPEWQGPGDDQGVRTLPEYLGLYKQRSGERYALDGSTIYLWSKSAPRRILELSPDAKVIICLRDPVDRAFSNYMQHRMERREHLGFLDAIRAEAHRKKASWSPFWLYTELSMYADSLERYFSLFGPDRVLVVLYDNLVNSWNSVISSLEQFLEIDLGWARGKSVHTNQAGQVQLKWAHELATSASFVGNLLKPVVPAQWRRVLRAVARSWDERWNIRRVKVDREARARLLPLFLEDIERTERILGVSLDRWKQV